MPASRADGVIERLLVLPRCEMSLMARFVISPVSIDALRKVYSPQCWAPLASFECALRKCDKANCDVIPAFASTGAGRCAVARRPRGK
jgi:hypothetical protein